MATITVPGMFLTGDHASRPAAGDVGKGTLYACSTDDLIYQSDGSSWTTWATLGGGGGVEVEDEGTPLATTATTLDFVGAGVVASGTGATKTITIAGSSGGLTQAYVGTNAIGGTSVAPSAVQRWHIKRITLANDCVVTDVEVYTQLTADVEMFAGVGLWDDDAGEPVHVLAYNKVNVVPEESGSGPRDARWLGGAIGRWCVAGSYWIGAVIGTTSANIFYDGSGTDREFTSGGSGTGIQSGDYGLWTPSTTTRNYSIRANTIR